MAPALMTAADLRRWLAGLALPPGGRPRLARPVVGRPVTFTTPRGDHWTIYPLATGAYLVAAGVPAGPCLVCHGAGVVTADCDGRCDECAGTGQRLAAGDDRGDQ